MIAPCKISSTSWFQTSKKVSCDHWKFLYYGFTTYLSVDEAKRVKDYYQAKGVPCPKDILANNEHVSANKPVDEDVNDVDFHRFDEQVSFFLLKYTATTLFQSNMFTRLIYAWNVERNSIHHYKDDF